MTTPTTQLAEIAEREAFETWLHSHPDNQGFQDRAAWLLSRYDDGQYQWKETHDRWIAWQGATSAAQARSRMDAEIMREAADKLEGAVVILSIPSRPKGAFCRICRKNTATPATVFRHTSGCMITKLRERADQLGGST